MNSDGIVLAFDTATEVVAIAVGTLERSRVTTTLGSLDFEAPRAAMSGLLPAVAGLLDELRLSPKQIAHVVVGRGPGSFTGVRIGVATAKGLAHGLGVPLFGVGTLDAIAWGAPPGFVGALGVVGDAMRGEVYPALFDITEESGGRLVHRRARDYVDRPGDAACDWATCDEPLLLAGNGLAKYAHVFTDALGRRATLSPESAWAPTGEGLLRAFTAAIEEASVVGGAPGDVLPIYTRLSDAEEAERARAGLPHVSPPVSGVDGAGPSSASAGATA